MNKQIEEMAKIIVGNGYLCKDEYLRTTGKHNRDNCEKCDLVNCCIPHRQATDLYNAGYRKQSEGENISQMHPSDEFICEKCGLIIRECCRYEIDEDDGDEICYEFPYQFCPRCGMKVKGGE